jgi:hypothetical protein
MNGMPCAYLAYCCLSYTVPFRLINYIIRIGFIIQIEMSADTDIIDEEGELSRVAELEEKLCDVLRLLPALFQRLLTESSSVLYFV